MQPSRHLHCPRPARRRPVLLQVQLESKPEAIDVLERQLMRLQVEAKALEKEKDSQSKARLEEVRRELGELADQLKPLQMRYRWAAAGGGGCTGVQWMLVQRMQMQVQGAGGAAQPTLTAPLLLGCVQAGEGAAGWHQGADQAQGAAGHPARAGGEQNGFGHGGRPSLRRHGRGERGEPPQGALGTLHCCAHMHCMGQSAAVPSRQATSPPPPAHYRWRRRCGGGRPRRAPAPVTAC